MVVVVLPRPGKVSIQWLLVKPGMCSIRRCAPHELYRHIIVMVTETASKFPFFGYRDSFVARNRS